MNPDLDVHFLAEAPRTPEVDGLFAEDVTDMGYVMNATRLWAYQPETMSGLFALMGKTIRAGGLTLRDRGIIVSATASTLGDSYCSIAYGSKLAGESSSETAAGVLAGDDRQLTRQEQALANWTRAIVRDPNGTTPADLDALRSVGYTDEQIFAITVLVGLRLAFSSVNDALGARPDAALAADAPAGVRAAVTFGRAVAPG